MNKLFNWIKERASNLKFWVSAILLYTFFKGDDFD